MADETFSRVTRKVRQMAATYTGSPALYFYGVAKNILHEYGRGRETSLSTQPEPSIPPEQLDEGDDAAERRHDCFEHCLKRLNAQERRVILSYYKGEGRAKIETRQRLAEELGIDLNALRVRTRRTRAKLRECIEKCLEEKPDAT
jgi:RNA polymerase sigma factor (sigma-70 family)